MTLSVDEKKTGDLVQSIALRKDKSVRQVLVQDSQGNIMAKGYFPEGTFMDQPGWIQKRMFHWIDAFSDEELLNPENGLVFDQNLINTLREESIIANMNKTFVDESLDKYKRK